jgi:hypothetical protein
LLLKLLFLFYPERSWIALFFILELLLWGGLLPRRARLCNCPWKLWHCITISRWSRSQIRFGLRAIFPKTPVCRYLARQLRIHVVMMMMVLVNVHCGDTWFNKFVGSSLLDLFLFFCRLTLLFRSY